MSEEPEKVLVEHGTAAGRRIDEMLAMRIPRIQKSCPRPDEILIPESGTYANQPLAAAPPFVAAPLMTVNAPSKKIQYVNAFSRGKAMSGAPIWSGTKKLASPNANGTTKKKIMAVPCSVKSWEYVCDVTID